MSAKLVARVGEAKDVPRSAVLGDTDGALAANPDQRA
jgi:hypothetical protein